MTTLEAQHEVITNLILENKKLEQERDELLIELEEYRSIAETIGAKKAVSEKEKAIRERDEARKEIRKVAVYLRKYNHDDAAESLEVFLESTK